MRPLRLEIEGFTSFRERVAIDFKGLDLFAITGPTGAGKSSIIDAMMFALYGQVPRVSREYRQLVSHGAERLTRCSLDFRMADRDLPHRAHRSGPRARRSRAWSGSCRRP